MLKTQKIHTTGMSTKIKPDSRGFDPAIHTWPGVSVTRASPIHTSACPSNTRKISSDRVQMRLRAPMARFAPLLEHAKLGRARQGPTYICVMTPGRHFFLRLAIEIDDLHAPFPLLEQAVRINLFPDFNGHCLSS